jgi:hypothetical protein
VPADRLSALRQAFAETMRDKDFLADAAKAGMDTTTLSADTVTEIVQRVAATPPDLIAAAKRAMTDPDNAR